MNFHTPPMYLRKLAEITRHKWLMEKFKSISVGNTGSEKTNVQNETEDKEMEEILM